MKILLSTILIALLTRDQIAAQQPAADNAVKQEIAALPSNSLVEVRVQGGSTLRGHIVSRGESDFALKREKGAGTQTIAYNQVLSVSQVKSGHSHKKWIILGVVVGAVVVVVVVVVVLVKTRGPFALS